MGGLNRRYGVATLGAVVLLGLLLCPVFADAAPRYYRGKRITLRLHKADIHHVLALFSETFHFNMVISKKVQGRVSIYFRNVPWDQALYWILRSLQLTAVVDGNVYQVAPLAERVRPYGRY